MQLRFTPRTGGDLDQTNPTHQCTECSDDGERRVDTSPSRRRHEVLRALGSYRTTAHPTAPAGEHDDRTGVLYRYCRTGAGSSPAPATYSPGRRRRESCEHGMCEPDAGTGTGLGAAEAHGARPVPIAEGGDEG